MAFNILISRISLRPDPLRCPQSFIRPGCTMLVVDVIVNNKDHRASGMDGLTALEGLVSGLSALRSDPNHTPLGRPIAVSQFLECLLGSAASLDSNRGVVIQAGTQVLNLPMLHQNMYMNGSE